MIKRETVTSLLVGFMAGACGIFPVVAGDGFSFGPAQGAASGGGGSGDLTAITETGSGITITSGTGPVPDLALEAGLEAIAGLAKTDGNVIVGDGSTWVAESGATARASLGLVIGTNVQAYDEELADVAGVTPTDNSVVAGNGSALAMETLTSLMDSAFGSTQGQILYRNATAWTVLAPGTSGQVLESGGAGADVSWGTDGGGASLAYLALDMNDGMAFVGSEANSASWDTRGGVDVVEFEASEAVSVDETFVWQKVMPSSYAGGTLRVTIRWAAEGATSGNVVWYVGVRRYVDGTTDMDTAGEGDFDTYESATAAACPATDGTFTTTVIDLTQAEADAIAAGELFTFLLARDSNEALDTLAVRAQVASITIAEQ